MPACKFCRGVELVKTPVEGLLRCPRCGLAYYFEAVPRPRKPEIR